MIYRPNISPSAMLLVGATALCALTACAPTDAADPRAAAARDPSVTAVPARKLGTLGAEPGVRVMEGEALQDWQSRSGAVRER